MSIVALSRVLLPCIYRHLSGQVLSCHHVHSLCNTSVTRFLTRSRCKFSSVRLFSRCRCRFFSTVTCVVDTRHDTRYTTNTIRTPALLLSDTPMRYFQGLPNRILRGTSHPGEAPRSHSNIRCKRPHARLNRCKRPPACVHRRCSSCLGWARTTFLCWWTPGNKALTRFMKAWDHGISVNV